MAAELLRGVGSWLGTGLAGIAAGMDPERVVGAAAGMVGAADLARGLLWDDRGR